MKYLISISLLAICLHTYARQAKAYNKVHYTATANDLRFRLDYAEGYMAASRIAVIRPHGRTQAFTPESNVPEANGNFNLQSDSGDMIQLVHIDENAPAPETIRGTYQMHGRLLNLLFRRTK